MPPLIGDPSAPFRTTNSIVMLSCATARVEPSPIIVFGESWKQENTRRSLEFLGMTDHIVMVSGAK